MAELNSGRNHLVPLSQIENEIFDVYHPPVEDRTKIKAGIMKWLRFKVEYGVTAFIAIGLLDYFRSDLFVKWRNILVCSGYAVAIYEEAGLKGWSRIMSPRELASRLMLKVKVNQ